MINNKMMNNQMNMNNNNMIYNNQNIYQQPSPKSRSIYRFIFK